MEDNERLLIFLHKLMVIKKRKQHLLIEQVRLVPKWKRFPNLLSFIVLKIMLEEKDNPQHQTIISKQ